MARTTAAISPVKQIDTGTYLFFGHPIPKQIVSVHDRYDPMCDGLTIMWVTRDFGAHSMTMNNPIDNDQITAVLTAMRMSC
jgi:hypothetical protein